MGGNIICGREYYMREGILYEGGNIIMWEGILYEGGNII